MQDNPMIDGLPRGAPTSRNRPLPSPVEGPPARVARFCRACMAERAAAFAHNRACV